MSADYTPGDGARTLRWVNGMVDVNGIRWHASAGPVHAPDLTDRATFLLALDQLAARVGGDGFYVDLDTDEWVVQHSVDNTGRAGFDPGSLDRALWETREVTP